MLLAECESLAHGFAHEAGAFAVVRWHVLSGSSLALTQYTGGRVTIQGGTRTLLSAIAGGAQFETRLETPVAAVAQTAGGVEVTTAAGETLPARAVIVAVPLNTLGSITLRAGSVRAQAGGDRVRPGVARHQDLRPRARRRGRRRTRSSRATSSATWRPSGATTTARRR